MVREAIDNGLCDQFTFGDAAKRLRLVQSKKPRKSQCYQGVI